MKRSKVALASASALVFVGLVALGCTQLYVGGQENNNNQVSGPSGFASPSPGAEDGGLIEYIKLVVWEWGDGDLSARESDCSPGDVGPSVYEARHIYRKPGDITVTAWVIEAGRVLARAETTVKVQPGPGQ